MKKIIITSLLLVFSTSLLTGETVLDFNNHRVRNWSQNSGTVYITVDAGDLTVKKAGATKIWVVLSARRLGRRFWQFYPEFTEKCIIGKAYDFKWIEAIPLDPASVTSNQFMVTNAKTAYYGFILVEKGNALSIVTPQKIGGREKYDSSELVSNPVRVANPSALERKWDDDKRNYCK